MRFRPGFQTIEAVHVSTLLIEKAVEYNNHLYCVETDIFKAFDRLEHAVLLEALRDAGVSEVIAAAFVREIRTGFLEVVLPSGRKTRHLPQTRGVRQGGCSSPLLFLAAYDFILRPLFQK